MKIVPTAKRGYVPELDGIRAIAIAAVLGTHSGNAPGGIWGVDMFLVLSGFLITTILYTERERSGTIAIGRFYLRRTMRLLPAVVVTVFVFIALGSAILSAAQGAYLWNDAASIFTYSANFWEVIHPMIIFGHFWSLSLEEQFYFLWPLLMLLLVGRVSTRKLVWALVALAVNAWVLGVVWYELAPSQAAWVTTMLPTRGLGLFVGAALALALKSGMLRRPPEGRVARRIERRQGRWALFLVIALLAIFRAAPINQDHLDRWSIFFGSALVCSMTAYILFHATSGADSLVNRILSNQWLVILGIWSYSLYLVHQPIFILFNHAGWPDEVREPVMIAVSIIAAGILHHAVERPFLNLRDRMRRRAVVEVEPVPA